MIKITNTVKHLVIINVLVFALKYILSQKGIDLDSILALHFPKSHLFQIWQLVSHIFMHGDINHLLFNMLALWMFGSALEQVFGMKKFLFFYFSAGIGAALISLGVDYIDYSINIAPYLSELNFSKEQMNSIMSLDIVQGNMFRGELLSEKLKDILSNNELSKLTNPSFEALFKMNIFAQKAMLGASGAIMGVLVGYGMLFPNSELMLLFFPVPVKAKYFIPVLIGLDVFSGLTGISIFSPNNTAYWAHIGGALTGLVMMLYWKKTQFNKNRWN